MVVPVRLSFARAPAHLGYPGLKGCKTVVVVVVVVVVAVANIHII